jgi:hypothetical protein
MGMAGVFLLVPEKKYRRQAVLLSLGLKHSCLSRKRYTGILHHENGKASGLTIFPVQISARGKVLLAKKTGGVTSGC